MYAGYTSDELYHHGVKGMKWGVRRYQNYDGSYTKRGVARYKQAEDKYHSAVSDLKSKKAGYKIGKNTKAEYKNAKVEKRKAKRELNSSYDKLKYDKRADQGKALYKKGKTITGNSQFNVVAQLGVVFGSRVVNQMIYAKTGNTRTAELAATSVALGGTAVNAIIAGKTMYENSRLRAYYSH